MCEISIVVPVYNKKKYLTNTVQSILNQTFTEFELLLIDDGSTDGSGKICDCLADSDKRVKVFHTINQGVSAARNYGIRKAGGKYIGFVDADDYVDKTFLEKLYGAIEEKNAGLAVCDYYEIKNRKKKNHNHRNYHSGNIVFEVLRQDLQCIVWNKLFVRNKIKHLFDEKISTCEDSIFCARYYYDNNPKIAYVNETLYGYLVHNDGLTSTLQNKSFLGINKLLVINRKISDRINDERLRYLAIHHIYRVYYFGIYTYIFENLSKGPMDREKLSIIEQIINDRKYQRIIKYIIKYSRMDRRAERASVTELLLTLLSILKLKRIIYVFSKVRKCLEPLTNR